MSRNFIKGGYVVMQKTETVPIDTNEAFQRRIEELQILQERSFGSEEETDGFSEGLDALQVAELVGDDDGTGLSLAEAEAAKAQAENLRKEAEMNSTQVIAEANAEADRIRREATEEANLMRQDAYNKGHEEGVSAGHAEGLKQAQEQYEAKFAALEQEQKRLQEEYERKCSSIEMSLVDTLTDIYSHVLGVALEDQKELVVNLLHKTLTPLDTSKNYIIHVTKEDIASVREKKSYLSKQTGIPEGNMEVIEDNTLPANGCLIESDSGIYDCGLGTQLELLSKQLKLISYEKEGNE